MSELQQQAEAIADRFEQRIDAPKYSRVSREKESAILKLAALGKTQTEIADIVGVSQPTVSRTLSEFADTREHAKAILNKSAARLAERVVDRADVAESLDVLERIDVIRAKERDSGAHGGVMVVVNMPGQLEHQPPAIDLSLVPRNELPE
jgi:predicted transcriptional regulator